MDKQKLVNLLGAGTVAAVVLSMVLVFGGGWGSTSAVDSPTTDNVQVVPLDSYNSLEQENEQLRQALDTMTDREAQYQAQLDQANQLLNEAAAPASGRAYEDEEHEAYEHEEDEHEEYEHEEYEHEYDDD